MKELKTYTLSDKGLEHGFVQIYDFGTMKLHAYQTADAMADECFVLETGKNLVAIESPPFDVNIAECREPLCACNCLLVAGVGFPNR